MITYLDGCDRQEEYRNRLLFSGVQPTRSDEELEVFFKELSKSDACGALRVIAQRKLRQVRERLAGSEA